MTYQIQSKSWKVCENPPLKTNCLHGGFSYIQNGADAPLFLYDKNECKVMKLCHKMLSKRPQKRADFYITNEKNNSYGAIGNSGGGVLRG